MKIGQKIRVFNVTGSTEKTGAKQNKLYMIIGQTGVYFDSKMKARGKDVTDLTMFHDAVDQKGNRYTIWQYSDTTIGIQKYGKSRYTYADKFELLDIY